MILIKEWERAKAYTKEYLDAMPESGYPMKPRPEMRSFAEQMLHIIDAHYEVTAIMLGEKNPVGFGEAEKIVDKSKENVTRLVMAGYDFVISAIERLPPEQLKHKIRLMDRFDLTKEVALAKLFEHQTHHRGQTTVYLRLAGIVPPWEKLFP